MIRFCEEGFRVIGFDVDPAKIESVNKGKSYIKHIPSEKIASFVKKPSPSFEATTDMSNLKRADAIIICVPTPLTDKERRISHILRIQQRRLKIFKTRTVDIFGIYHISRHYRRIAASFI